MLPSLVREGVDVGAGVWLRLRPAYPGGVERSERNFRMMGMDLGFN